MAPQEPTHIRVTFKPYAKAKTEMRTKNAGSAPQDKIKIKA